MKIFKALAIVGLLFTAACDYIEPGNVGVKVTTAGGDRGVQRELLQPGRHWIGWGERLYTFPTFVQTYVWDAGGRINDSISFQDARGAVVNADIGIQYSFELSKIPDIFQRYRFGVEELNNSVLRSIVRDALATAASTRQIEDIIGAGRTQFMDEVLAQVRATVGPQGIDVVNVFSEGQFRLDTRIVEAINRRISAAQETEQRRQQVETARQEAERQRIEAEGNAAANRIVAASITPELVQYMAAQKWDGRLPQATSGVPFISLPVPAARQ